MFRAGSEDPGIEEWLGRLRGLSVLQFSGSASSKVPDLRLECEESLWLEIFVASGMDPWTLQLPRGPVIIAAPLDAQWISRPRD